MKYSIEEMLKDMVGAEKERDTNYADYYMVGSNEKRQEIINKAKEYGFDIK